MIVAGEGNDIKRGGEKKKNKTWKKKGRKIYMIERKEYKGNKGRKR